MVRLRRASFLRMVLSPRPSYSPHYSVQFSRSYDEESSFDNQAFLKLVIISCILKTFIFDSGVIPQGESRTQSLLGFKLDPVKKSLISCFLLTFVHYMVTSDFHTDRDATLMCVIQTWQATTRLTFYSLSQTHKWERRVVRQLNCACPNQLGLRPHATCSTLNFVTCFSSNRIDFVKSIVLVPICFTVTLFSYKQSEIFF